MGIPALEDGLFANLLIFDYLYYICVWERKREGKREGKKGREKEREKGREKGKGITKIARVPSCEVGSTVIRDYTVSVTNHKNCMRVPCAGKKPTVVGCGLYPCAMALCARDQTRNGHIAL